MRFPLVIIFSSILITSCRKHTTIESNNLDRPEASELSFSEKVGISLENKRATVVMNAILRPGEVVDMPSVVGSKTVGYFVDDHSSRELSNDFIYIQGSDGSESKSIYGVEWSKNDGTIQASYKVTNQGEKTRRILVYTTQLRLSDQ